MRALVELPGEIGGNHVPEVDLPAPSGADTCKGENRRIQNRHQSGRASRNRLTSGRGRLRDGDAQRSPKCAAAELPEPDEESLWVEVVALVPGRSRYRTFIE